MSYTILAIDDAQKILNIVRFFLEGDGYEVKTANDPIEGIKIAKGGGIDLIILDIMMPKMDGYQVCDVLKQDERTREIPVVMLTAKAVVMSTPKSFFYGLYGFLTKPFTKRQLLDKIEEVLGITSSESDTKIIDTGNGEGGA